MHALPTDWFALCGVVFLLGIRHGLDADHLAAIDGLTRLSAGRRQGHARLCGALFSLGHGAVVMAIALAVGLLGSRWVPPAWFETLGGLISIGFLTLIGVLNLAAVWRAPTGQPVAMVGLRGRMVDRLLGGQARRSGPVAVAGVGALFALSFDTLSQSALFAAVGVPFGGTANALMLGGLFVAGMLLADGANGWWVSRLLARTDRMAVVASRTMTMAVAALSLLVAAMGAARMGWPAVGDWLEQQGLAVGGAVIALVALSYAMACRHREAPQPSSARA